MPFPNPDSQFRPGQSGNPSGSSKRQRIAGALIQLIDEKNADRKLALRWLNEALEGDFRFFHELLDRVDGPVMTRPEPGRPRPTPPSRNES